MKGDNLFHQHIACCPVPVWILVREFAAMRCELENPPRINAGNCARKKLRGFDNLTSNDPLGLVGLEFWGLIAFAGRFLVQFASRKKRGARKHRQQTIAGRLVTISLLKPGAMADQSGQDRAMDRIVSRVALVEPERAEIIERVMQL